MRQLITIRWLVFIPILFGLILLIFWQGLGENPSNIPSALIGKSVPDFNLPALEASDAPGFTNNDLISDRPIVVNFWASWCLPCRAEHPLLTALGKRDDIYLFGVNYKDEPENAVYFLKSLGQPYAAIIADRLGEAALNWGLYGVPESYVIDKAGKIKFKWIGPLTPDIVDGPLAQAIKEANLLQPQP